MGPPRLECFSSIPADREYQFWRRWNEFVQSFGTNAFYLGGFIDHYMKAYLKDSRRSGWTPKLFVMGVEGMLVGGAALNVRGVYGERTATLLLPKAYGADFVVDPEYREVFVSSVLEFLFKKAKCQFLDLTLPCESPNVGIIQERCRALGYEVNNAPLREDLREHSVIEVNGTWEDFKSSRGSGFVRRYKEIEQLLSKAGNWRTRQVPLDGPGPVEIIDTIERNSWKDGWRRERGIASDPNLPAFFAYWKLKSSLPGYYPSLYLLELNGEPIAHTIMMKLNGVALLRKTSFDQRYAKLSPGEYVQNAAIQDAFNSGEVSMIDFLTALPYLRRWTAKRLPRERVTASRSVPVLTSAVKTLEKSSLLRSTYKTLWRSRRRGPREGVATK